MRKHLLITATLVLLIVCSLIMMAAGSLDGAAAWANIIALPVAIAGLGLTLHAKGAPDHPGRVVQQVGYGRRQQLNVAGDYIVRDHDERHGR